MKNLLARILLVLGILMVGMFFTSCELISTLFSGDDEDSIAVTRPDNKLSDKPLESENFSFNAVTDLDSFYLFNIVDEDPEWERKTNLSRGVASYHMEPMRDNNPLGGQADMAWLIDLGEKFTFSFDFKTPENTTDFTGPNLTFRFDYDEDKDNEYGVITVKVRKKPITDGKLISPSFELLVDQWKPDRSTVLQYPNHVGDYQPIEQLQGDTWYTLNIAVRDGNRFLVDLSSGSRVIPPSVSYTFFEGESESFYNPTFWAYLDANDSRTPIEPSTEPSDEYWIGSIEAAIRGLD